MSKAVMIQGTGSGVGKSVIVAGLCRVLRQMGISVAPFKAQNMALNSFITKEGGEIGRAQALQAEAAGIEPSNDMNPVLLKATGEAVCQVILNGRVYGNMNAMDYYAFKDMAWEVVKSAYDRLSQRYEVVVIEGAGSPAEINLMNDEIVNMRVARYADAPVILVGDIDKGGVFASLYGTIELLKNHVTDVTSHYREVTARPSDADYIKAFIINKFRGDINILRPGLRMLEDRTGKPVIGVIRYLGDLGIHEEDAIPVERLRDFKSSRPLRIVVLRLRHVSNFTDFDPFMYEPDVELIYSLREEDINTADLIVIPGSKNTIGDLLFLRGSGVEECIKSAVRRGVPLVGVCGGYQMLGRKIYDPFGIEGSCKEIEGFGLLDIETTIEKTKVTSQVEASVIRDRFPFSVMDNRHDLRLKGYEIHMGKTTGDVGLFRLKRIAHNACSGAVIMDGSSNGNVWGTYIHGIFDNDEFRNNLLNLLRVRKGYPPLNGGIRFHEVKEFAMNRWTEVLKQSVDICFILRLLGMKRCITEHIQSL